MIHGQFCSCFWKFAFQTFNSEILKFQNWNFNPRVTLFLKFASLERVTNMSRTCWGSRGQLVGKSFSPSTMWVPEIKLTAPGWEAGTFCQLIQLAQVDIHCEVEGSLGKWGGGGDNTLMSGICGINKEVRGACWSMISQQTTLLAPWYWAGLCVVSWL